MALEYWKRRATEMGYSIDSDGAGRLIAHIDGKTFGEYDSNYAGSGHGWFY